MAYRFKLNEPVDKGLQRIAEEQIDLAIEHLRSGDDRVAAIHEARKCLKRLRALMKLLRPAFEGDGYRRENQRFRDIARLLSGTRDSDVLRATAQRFADGGPAKVRKAALALVARAEAAREAAAEQDNGGGPVEEAIAALVAARKELDDLKLRSNGFGSLRRGLEKNYRDGRRAMMAAYDEHHDEAFHEWRKAVQAHWRHMGLLERVWPEVMGARAVLAKETADLLGEDHDIYMLIAKAMAATENASKPVDNRDLIAIARQRQQEIRRQLAAKGEALYAEPAAEFADRIGHYWHAAKAARRLARRTAAATEMSDDEDSRPNDEARRRVDVPAEDDAPKDREAKPGRAGRSDKVSSEKVSGQLVARGQAAVLPVADDGATEVAAVAASGNSETKEAVQGRKRAAKPARGGARASQAAASRPK